MLKITSKGFSFLFKSITGQVWDILTNYLKYLSSNMIKKEAIEFIFRLSFLNVGQGYTMKKLTATQQAMVIDLASYGIIYHPLVKGKRNRFYPTHLATSIKSSSNLIPHNLSYNSDIDHKVAYHNDDGFIIVENTFKVYAFTTNSLHIALLGLFVHFTRKLPNMITGVITKQSCNDAFLKNVTAKDIFNYLLQHTHPNTKNDRNPIPLTVLDRIKLWEEENFRLRYDDGIMITNYYSLEQFNDVLQLAQQHQAVLFHNQKKGIIILKDEIFDSLKPKLKQIEQKYK